MDSSQQSNLVQEVQALAASEGGRGSADDQDTLSLANDVDYGYQIYFDDKVVPATLIQSGVLKAQCPGLLLKILMFFFYLPTIIDVIFRQIM